MAGASNMWAHPGLETAIRWCKERNSQGIRCIIAVLGEHARDKQEVFRWVKENIACIRAIELQQVNASVSIKLTAFGALFDKDLCDENVQKVFNEAVKRHVPFEIDMEGKGLTGFTIETGLSLARTDNPVTMALQAYMKRTRKDLPDIVAAGITPRVVKGAYLGDLTGIEVIEENFKTIIEEIIPSDSAFSVATHDPELITWAREHLSDEKNRVEFGFLMGLSDLTKRELLAEGWTVSEYVPYGEISGAYIARREHYLSGLQETGRSPAP